MTKREFRRLKAGNLVQEDISHSLWVVVDRRRFNAPASSSSGRGRSEGGIASWLVPEDFPELNVVRSKECPHIVCLFA